MDVERFSIKACCGRMATVFKTSRPLSINDVTTLVKLGFVEHTHFTKAGILYADNSDFILTGPIGSDRLQVKCRFAECSQKLNDLEVLLKQIG
jgi:hypothetical protein